MYFKQILLGTAAAVSLVALAQSNTAQARNHGWYIGIEGGANWIQDNDFQDVQPFDKGDPTNNLEQSFDTGWAALATVGYAFDNHWRVEGEFGYRRNKLDKTKTFAGNGESQTTTNTHGDLSQFTAMANVLYDISLTDKLSLSLGVGVGAADEQLKLTACENEGCPDGEHLNDDHWTFAYQGIAGLNYELTHRIDLFVNYRYLNADPTFASPFERASFDNFQNHTVTIGLRFDLTPDEEPMAAEPPRQPPPPMPSEPHEFILFFGFNKSNLTPEAHRVVQEAAAAARQYGTASILITGHTDTVGSNRYNMRLSMRRANAAKAGLVAEGVSPHEITTTGKGETELLVQTGDNVKEPQNRRAAIDLQ